jgi:hypothetical protein
MYEFEDQIIGPKEKALQEGQRLTVRRQQCQRCSSVLALEITYDMGHGGDYYVARDALIIKGETRIMYDKKRWFGNFIKCPVCGLEGRLPQDKPLNWENMQKTKETRNAI